MQSALQWRAARASESWYYWSEPAGPLGNRQHRLICSSYDAQPPPFSLNTHCIVHFNSKDFIIRNCVWLVTILKKNRLVLWSPCRVDSMTRRKNPPGRGTKALTADSQFWMPGPPRKTLAGKAYFVLKTFRIIALCCLHCSAADRAFRALKSERRH
jgi:hypothetical protein